MAETEQGGGSAGRVYWIQGRSGVYWQNLECDPDGQTAIARLSELVGADRYDELRLIQAEISPITGASDYLHIVTVRDGQVLAPNLDMYATNGPDRTVEAAPDAMPQLLLWPEDAPAPGGSSAARQPRLPLDEGASESAPGRSAGAPAERRLDDGDWEVGGWRISDAAHAASTAPERGDAAPAPGDLTADPDDAPIHPRRPRDRAGRVGGLRRLSARAARFAAGDVAESPGGRIALMSGLFAGALAIGLSIAAVAPERAAQLYAAALQDVRAVAPKPGLSQAVAAGDLTAAMHRLSAGADPNAQDAEGAPLLLRAARGGNLQMVSLLLQAGADPTRLDGDGRSVLHRAAAEGRALALERMLDAGAPVDLAGGVYGCLTPLAAAAANGKARAATILAERGAALTPQPGCRAGPMEIAAAHPLVLGRLEAVRAEREGLIRLATGPRPPPAAAPAAPSDDAGAPPPISGADLIDAASPQAPPAAPPAAPPSATARAEPTPPAESPVAAAPAAPDATAPNATAPVQVAAVPMAAASPPSARVKPAPPTTEPSVAAVAAAPAASAPASAPAGAPESAPASASESPAERASEPPPHSPSAAPPAGDREPPPTAAPTAVVTVEPIGEPPSASPAGARAAQIASAIDRGDAARVTALIDEVSDEALAAMSTVADDRYGSGERGLVDHAVLRGRRTIADALIARGLAPTPAALHAAIMNADRPELAGTVDWLIARGVDVDARLEGLTPLMRAALRGRSDLAEALLAAGADPGASTEDGRIASDFARRAGRPTLQETLLLAAQEARYRSLMLGFSWTDTLADLEPWTEVCKDIGDDFTACKLKSDPWLDDAAVVVGQFDRRAGGRLVALQIDSRPFGDADTARRRFEQVAAAIESRLPSDHGGFTNRRAPDGPAFFHALRPEVNQGAYFGYWPDHDRARPVFVHLKLAGIDDARGFYRVVIGNPFRAS